MRDFRVGDSDLSFQFDAAAKILTTLPQKINRKLDPLIN